MLGIKGKVVTRNENFDNCARKLLKITCKTFHRNTYFCLISGTCLQCFVQDCLHRKFCSVYRKNNICGEVSFLVKFQASCLTLHKETPAQVFSWDFYENFRNTFLIELIRLTANISTRFVFTTLMLIS